VARQTVEFRAISAYWTAGNTTPQSLLLKLGLETASRWAHVRSMMLSAPPIASRPVALVKLDQRPREARMVSELRAELD
jgi:hypothetical protein